MKTELIPLLYFMLLNIGVVLAGYILVKKQQLALSWLLLIISVASIYLTFIPYPAIVQMLAIIATTFTCMKVIAVTCSYKDKVLTLTFKQWLAFAIGWAGMRAQPFETLGGPALPQAWLMIRFGISRIVAGALLILLARTVLHLPLNAGLIYVLVSSMLLIGFSLILHFGLLGISAGVWRLSGVHTYVLFNKPAMATSLTEFWSKRWNLAFSEMTSIAILRPLKNKTGQAVALMVAFLFSGLLHELALSVPVHSGYGLPMLYFIIQGALVLMEKAFTLNKVTFLKHRMWARVWLFFWLVVPMPLLFHAQFIKKILWPMAGLNL